MKKLAIVMVVSGLLALGGQSLAEMCAIDPVPAATLLLPYFEVDTTVGNGEGRNTLFSINNASAAPTIAHVTIWSNWSVPVIDFDVYLTGYDVQSINLWDIIVNENHPLPRTADPDGDPSDTISPSPIDPDWDDTSLGGDPTFGPLDTTTCPLPYSSGAIGTILADRLNALTGVPMAEGPAAGNCLGGLIEDGLAIGYVTVDNANQCSLDFPNAPDYFSPGGGGVASNINQLWGDFFIVDAANNFAQADNLVHIEADDFFDNASTPTGYTFYGRFTSNPSLPTHCGTGCDNREPLGTTWAARYITAHVFDGTDYLVWRDSTSGSAPTDGFSCAVGPSWFPLYENEVVAFNEAEDAVELCFLDVGCPVSPCGEDEDVICFPYETQRVSVGEGELTPPFNFGWMYLNLNHPATPEDSPAADVDFGFNDGDIAQSWVGQIHSAAGRYSGGYSAIELTSACDDLNPRLTDLWPIFTP